MRNVRLWRALLGVDKRTVIEDIEFSDEGEDAEVVVARVRPRSGVSQRCGRCGSKAPWYDRGEGPRRWRGLDLGTVQVLLEADAPRVSPALSIAHQGIRRTAQASQRVQDGRGLAKGKQSGHVREGQRPPGQPDFRDPPGGRIPYHHRGDAGAVIRKGRIRAGDPSRGPTQGAFRNPRGQVPLDGARRARRHIPCMRTMR